MAAKPVFPAFIGASYEPKKENPRSRSLVDPPLIFMWAAGVPLVPSPVVTEVSEVYSLSLVLSVTATTLCCVWATHSFNGFP